jgi:hypothetical protein
MVGIDTIHLLLPAELSGGSHKLLDAIQHLERVSQTKNQEGRFYWNGHLKNLRVSISEHRITVQGSIAKYLNGNNVQLLSKAQLKKAILMIGKDLNLPIKMAFVNRVDIAMNLQMNQPPEMYHEHLGQAKYFKRSKTDSTLYYKKTSEQMVFYDKLDELKNHHQPYKHLPVSNLLRIEYRAMKNPANLMGLPSLQAFQIYEVGIYSALLDKFRFTFDSIEKLSKLSVDMDKIKKPKDLINTLTIAGISSIGGQDQVLKIVDELKKAKAFKRPEAYSRLRKSIRSYNKAGHLLDESELIEELKEKFITACEIK